MIQRKKILCSTIMIAVTVLYHDANAVQSSRKILLENLAENKKIVLPKEVLADFAENKEETEVVVLVKPVSLSPSARSANDHGLRSEAGKRNARASAAAAIKSVVDQIDSSQVKVTSKFSYINGFAATVTSDGLKQLSELSDVVSIEKNRTLYLKTSQGIPLMNATAVRNTYNGTGVSIALIDNGVDYTHPDIGGAALGVNTKVIGGYDTGDNDADPMPNAPIADNSHGTSCAGIAAGSITATGGDYIGGVAPGAKLYALKVQSSTNGIRNEYIINALEWAITHQNDSSENPILIASISLGGGKYTSVCDSDAPSEKAIADKAIAAGITMFAASGNEYFCDGMCSPACISEIISVGAVYDTNFMPTSECIDPAGTCLSLTDDPECVNGQKKLTDTSRNADQVTAYSNTASFLDLLAPSHTAATPKAGGGYDSVFGGTSAATPYAAGAAAVLQSAAKAKFGRYLTPHEVKMYLTKKGDNITDTKVAVTKPRINLGNVDAVLANCGLGLPLTANTWVMTAPSCPPSPSAAISSQYGDDIAGGVYDTNWVAYKRDAAADKYVKLASSDDLSLGAGNWIYSTIAGSTLKLTAAAGSSTADSAVDCKEAYGAAYTVKCRQIDLAIPAAGSTRWNLVGFPYTSPLDWSAVKINVFNGGTSASTYYSPSEAEIAGYVGKTTITGMATPILVMTTSRLLQKAHFSLKKQCG